MIKEVELDYWIGNPVYEIINGILIFDIPEEVKKIK